MLLNKKQPKMSTPGEVYLDDKWLNPEDAAEKLCSYFLSVSNSTSINENDIQTELPSGTCLTPPTETEVLNLLSKIREHKASGLSAIPAWLLRRGRHSIIRAVMSIIRNIFTNRVFPDAWKSAKVCPIPKKPSPSMSSDFRPISLLDILSKVVEKTIKRRYQEELKEHLANQHAYVDRGGTTNALISIFDKWTKALDTGVPYVRAIMADFTKAFDRMRKDTLLKKQLEYNIDPGLISITQSFLNNRTQSVSFNGTNSRFMPVTGGVPQGSVLGPWLWLTYISDLQPCEEFDIYADDITMSIVARDEASLHRKAQKSIEAVELWCQANNMSLSLPKTVELLISAKHSKSASPINIGRCNIEQVKSAKLLGITTDCHLTFSDHVEICRKKAFQRIYWLRTLKRFGGRKEGLLRIYHSNIRSLFEYACPAWFPHITKASRQKIERTEKCALRAIFPNLSYEDAINEHNIIPILSHINNIILTHFTKMKNPNHPLHYLFPPTQWDISQRTSASTARAQIPPGDSETIFCDHSDKTFQ